MTELEKALLHIKTRADAWAVKVVKDALSQEPCDDAISRDMALEKMADYVASGYADSAEDFAEYSRIICQLPSVTQKSGKWIPVSERLPEDKTYVLTTIKVPNRIAHARSSWYECGFFHNDNGDTWRATDMEVKAWMPLPHPYEPQESEDKG